jgi:hypothetical protein
MYKWEKKKEKMYKKKTVDLEIKNKYMWEKNCGARKLVWTLRLLKRPKKYISRKKQGKMYEKSGSRN